MVGSLTFPDCTMKYREETWNSSQNDQDENEKNFWQGTFIYTYMNGKERKGLNLEILKSQI